MPPLRILMAVPYFYPAWSYGGIPRLAYGLARALAQRGHQITVATTDALSQGDRAAPRQERLGGIQVHRFPNLSNRLAYHHQGFLPRGMRAFLLGGEGGPYDLYHVHGHRHLPGVWAHQAARRAGAPLLLHPNGTLPALERKQGVKAVFDRVFGEAVVAGAAHHVAVSRAEVNQMVRWGIPASRISVVPNGLDLAEFEALPPLGSFKARHGLTGRRIVLYLGKITPRKGVDHLIDAFARLGDADVTLVVAGNDMAGLRPALERQAAARGLGDRARFIGLVEGEERLAALADACVLAYPSTDEIFGLVPFEGLLAGAPAVVGDDCGCGELVQAAGAGLLVRYGDTWALTAALRRLLDDPDDRAARVARGRSWIARHFDWTHVAGLMEAVYLKALARGSGAP